MKKETGNEDRGALKSADLLIELNCSRSTFCQMLADGSFPAADLTVGKSGKRWTRNLYNAWLSERSGERGPGRPRGGQS